MSSKVARSVSSVYQKHSEARDYEKFELESNIKPQLVALLTELLEELGKIEDSTKKKITGYTLPGVRFDLKGRKILKYPEHYGDTEVYDPVRYVKENVRSIHDASILLNRIREFEQEGFINFDGSRFSSPEREYKGKITLTGKYFPDARRLYNGELPLAVAKS